MTAKTFSDFIDQICVLVKIDDPKDLYESADLVVNDMKFTLMDATEEENFGIAFFCDFGKVPRNDLRADALQRLLEINLGMFGINTPLFSINAETDHVLLIGRVEAKKVTPTDLLKALEQYSVQAKEWNKSYYLTSEEHAGLSPARSNWQKALMKNAE